MAINEKRRQVEIARDLQSNARSLAHSTRDVSAPTDSYTLLGDLNRESGQMKKRAAELPADHPAWVFGYLAVTLGVVLGVLWLVSRWFSVVGEMSRLPTMGEVLTPWTVVVLGAVMAAPTLIAMAGIALFARRRARLQASET